MKTSKILLPLLVSCGIAFTGCGSQNKDTPRISSVAQVQKESTKSGNVESLNGLGNQYLKPGAAVAFNHDYDGKTDVAEIEPINIHVLPSLDMEALRIRVTSLDGLMISGDILFQGSAVGQQPVTIPVAIQSSSEGRYYINVQVDSVIEGLAQSRSFTLPVIIGDATANAKAKRVIESNGELIRVMPASEKPN